MLGTAIGAMNTLGEAKASLENLGESFGKVLPPVTWGAFHIGGGFVAGQTVADILNPGERTSPSLKPIIAKTAYVFGSAIGNVYVNGPPANAFKIMRDAGAFTTMSILGYYRGISASVPNRNLMLGIPAAMFAFGGAVEGIKSWRNR